MVMQLDDAVLTIPDAADCSLPPLVTGGDCGTCFPGLMGCSAQVSGGLSDMVAPMEMKAPSGGTGTSAAGSCSACPTPSAPMYSANPIRYATGELYLEVNDLPGGNGYGLPWGMRRSYSSRLSSPFNLGLGRDWQLKEWPHLALIFNDLELRRGAREAYAFRSIDRTTVFLRDTNSTTYQAVLGSQDELYYDPVDRTYLQVMPDRSQTLYGELTGAFETQTDATGNVITVLERAANKFNPVVVGRTCQTPTGPVSETYTYEIDDPDSHDALITRVTLSRGGTDVSRVTYTYYDTGSSFGRNGDLRTAETELWSDTEWISTGTAYYRYGFGGSSSSSSSSGGANLGHSLLRYVLGPAAFERLCADPGVSDPFTASNSIVALYADHYYEYDGERRVTKEMVHGASQTFLYSYAFSDFTTGIDVNTWVTKTVETLPDGTQNIVFSNASGQTLLEAVSKI